MSYASYVMVSKFGYSVMASHPEYMSAGSKAFWNKGAMGEDIKVLEQLFPPGDGRTWVAVNQGGDLYTSPNIGNEFNVQALKDSAAEIFKECYNLPHTHRYRPFMQKIGSTARFTFQYDDWKSVNTSYLADNNIPITMEPDGSPIMAMPMPQTHVVPAIPVGMAQTHVVPAIPVGMAQTQVVPAIPVGMAQTQAVLAVPMGMTQTQAVPAVTMGMAQTQAVPAVTMGMAQTQAVLAVPMGMAQTQAVPAVVMKSKKQKVKPMSKQAKFPDPFKDLDEETLDNCLEELYGAESLAHLEEELKHGYNCTKEQAVYWLKKKYMATSYGEDLYRCLTAKIQELE